MQTIDVDQGSEEWFAARRGKVTASRIADVMARTKTGWGASRANYAAQLIAERLTGVTVDGYRNAEMQWGSDMEPEARVAYEFMTGARVMAVGFVEHPTIPMAGASPDGLVGTEGLVEIKAPNTATHIDTLVGQSIAGKYELQMQWQMACTGRRWCDFVSYDPRMPDHLRLFVRRLRRDEKVCLELENGVREFLKEIDGRLADLKRLYPEPVNILDAG